MVICMRSKEKEKKIGYNNHLLILINLSWTNVITIRSFNCGKIISMLFVLHFSRLLNAIASREH